MPTPADLRLLELLDKWLASLALHLKYAALDDESYWNVQPWIKHQRPSKWILDLAQQKAIALRAEVQKRIETHDVGFSDAMELMNFLANLVGSQHIERFIPLADPQIERPAEREPAAPSGETTREARRPNASMTATREMPKFLSPAPREHNTKSTPEVARPERKAPHEPAKPMAGKSAATTQRSATLTNSAAKSSQRQPARSGTKQAARPHEKSAAEMDSAISPKARDQVIADAVRLTQWGRKWYELAELISRMADRPGLPEVRRMLKDNKALIDKKLGR